jgi:MFS transporter, DHA1 family, multidrug resistance protein
MMGDKPVDGAPVSMNANNKAALIILYLTMFLTVAGFGIITPFFPFFAKEVGANAFQLGLMVTLFSLAQVIAAPFWGRLSDRVGRKPVLVLGLVGYALSFYMLILAPNIQVLMLARVVGGLLSASAFPSAQAYLVDLTPIEKRGYGMSYMAAASNLGFLLGPALGSLFSVFGIRAAFAIGGTLILVTGILGGVFLPATGVKKTENPPMIRQNRQEIWSAMVGRESAILWVTLLISFGSSTMYSILGYYIIEKFNALSTDSAIVYTLMGGISAILQAFIVGWAIKRVGEDNLIIGALLLGAAGFAGFIFAPNLFLLYLWVVIISASLALARPAILVALSHRTHLGQGMTMGLQGSFDSFGRVIGPLWAGWIFGFSLSAPYWSSVAAFALGAVVYFSVSRVQKMTSLLLKK